VEWVLYIAFASADPQRLYGMLCIPLNDNHAIRCDFSFLNLCACSQMWPIIDCRFKFIRSPASIAVFPLDKQLEQKYVMFFMATSIVTIRNEGRDKFHQGERLF